MVLIACLCHSGVKKHIGTNRTEKSLLRADKAPCNAQTEAVQEIAQSILEVGQQAPILVRRDGDRLVLVHGLQPLDACKALGEETIDGYLVQAVKH